MVDWNTKPKIAAASMVIGLLVGAGWSGQGDEPAVAAPKDEARGLLQKAEVETDARVQKATADAKQANETVTAAAVAAAVADEQAKRQDLIDAAVDKAVKKVKASSPEPARLVDADPVAADPRFDTCGEANDAGYGNYQQGADPEYEWYQDRDGDGAVCE